MVFLLIMPIIFLMQDSTIYIHFESLKEQLACHDLNYFLKHKQDVFFFTYKTLRAIITLFYSNYLPSFFYDWKFIPSYLYLLVSDLFICILSAYFPISSWLQVTVTAYWNYLLCFLLIEFMVVLFVFYPIRRIYISSTPIRIYFMTFIIH